MPNYSHGTKLTLASAEEPPYLTVGTDVSAKYKGAFCEAKITDVNKHVKLRVLFDGLPGSYLIDDTDLKAGSTLETGTRIEARHPKKKQQAYVQATITKILDHSRYTVVFDDGDQCVLRRNSLCLKSGKHFAESETLDQLPLTNPEHFGNPVKVRGPEQLNNSSNASKSQNNHLLLNNKPRGKSSSSTTNSSSTTSEDSKSNAAELTSSGRKRQHHNNQDSINDNNKRLKKERSTAQNITSTGTGRRGSTKDRKRRESINNGSKNAMGLDNDSLDSSIDSGDAYTGETDVKFELIEVGVKLMVQYGKGKIQNFYEAKVNKIETNAAGRIRYFVHYTGWNNRYDEWITKNRIHSIVADKDNGSRDGRSKHQPEVNTAQSTTVSVASTTAPATTGPTVNSSTTTTAPSKSSLTNSSNTTTTPSKSSTTSSSTTTTTLSKGSTTNSSTTTTAPSKTSTTNSSTTTTTPSKISTTNSSTATTTPSKIEPKEKEKEKEVLPRTRRARQSEASIANNITVTTPIAQVATTTAISVTVTSSSSTTTTTTPVDDTPSSQTVNSTKVVPKAAVESPPPAESNITPVTIPCTQVATSPISSVTVTSSTSTVTTTSVTTNVSPGHADDLIKDAPISVRSPIAQSNPIEVEKAVPSPASIKAELVPDETSTTESNSQNTTNSLAAVDDPRPSYRFCDEIDESDCDRKISILQERIMALRQTYTALKTELADLDRRKKRPRTERSNSDHISNCSVVCRS